MDAYIADPGKNTCTSKWSTWHTVQMGSNVVEFYVCAETGKCKLYTQLTSFYDSDTNNLSLFWCRRKKWMKFHQKLFMGIVAHREIHWEILPRKKCLFKNVKIKQQQKSIKKWLNAYI